MKRIRLDDMTTRDLERLYARLEAVEAVVDRIPYAERHLRRALEQLPERCRYHGDRLDPDHFSWGREACCDTGTPSLRRRRALAALDQLTAMPPETPGDTGPDTSTDTVSASGGVLRTLLDVGESVDCGPLPTSTDTVRTPGDTDTEDIGQGVRIEYRASVPRHMLGAAVAEAFGIIARETAAAPEEPPPADAPPDHE
ncbi:hypothetical protein J7E96_28335 [Streptomyces sp. ISL-96]|uniref:hypothetical protein n=1 Tax=Streptomyces sp. ISL-96 TaxID=2819191 RepID=UPI001BE9B487|nr:hypothetical protein [Streptomyces sp. ISL-96]MBT2492349.1 hypothetical protein [Streptomyces sp. ISL-96]